MPTRPTSEPSPRRLPWPRRLQLRILAVTLLAIVVIEIVILVPTTVLFRGELRERFFERAAAAGGRAAPDIAKELHGGIARPHVLAGLAGVPGAESAVYDANGAVVWATEAWPGDFATPVVRARLAQPSPALLEGETEMRCFVVYPVRDMDGSTLGALAVVKPAERLLAETLGYVARILGLVLIICLFTGTFLFLFLYREVVRPIERIVEANVETAAGGDAAGRIDPKGMPVNELGEIMRTRNRMLDRLRGAREELIAANDELERLNRTLEQRVAERTAALQQTRERAAQAEKLAAIGRLAASVAHEINNPLGIIRAGAEDVRRTLGAGRATEETERGLEIIDSQIARCQRIIDSLLNYSRRTPSLPEPVDLRAFLERTLQLVEHRAAGEGKRLVLDAGGASREVVVMQTQLQQALVNLLENALDASEEGQTVRVRASVDGGEAVVSVADDGPGIPESERGRIFEPFYSTKEPGRGAGMGLTIASSFVRAHGGRIEADSQPGGGTTFRVHLPVEGPAEAPA